MQIIEQNIPDYLTDDFSLFLENMSSLTDPENPELLTHYLANLFEQLTQAPLLFTDMVDQLAMAISTKVRVNSKDLAKLDLSNEPTWGEIKPFIAVHGEARACIVEIMTHAEQALKTAILLIHFHQSYDATPLKAEHDDTTFDDDEFNDYDENY